jgi:hypothetical protein
MADWWTVPYKTGPKVQVDGFPRLLYPPDAAPGRNPSADGPDVEAYKRTVSRAGRWPWQTFDQTYSNGFAHGTGGNVVNTGMAGVQRQQGIPDTGWLGPATFDLLRSIIVPDGLPNAGQPAMDATAANLINKAYAQFQPALVRKSIPSPNYSVRMGASVRLIVLHTAEGATTYQSLGAFFAKPSTNASSHVGIDDTDGVIGQYVRRTFKAWTAVNANPVAVQAELCAFAAWTAADWRRHPNMLRNCARWIAEEADAFDIPIVRLTPQQAQTGGRGVCQHSDLGAWGGGHWDCGGGFPIDDVLEMARGL